MATPWQLLHSVAADAEDPCRALVDGQDAELPSWPSSSPRRGARWLLGVAAAAAMLGAMIGAAVAAWGQASGRVHFASFGNDVGMATVAKKFDTRPVKIVWVEDTSKCVGVPGGLEEVKSFAHLQLVSCAEALLFTVPTLAEPRIHPIQKPELCVDNPGITEELMLFDCDVSGDKILNLLFTLLADGKNHGRGMIQTIKNTSRCMDTPRNEIGAPVQMWECMPDNTHQLFVLQYADLYG